MPQNLILKLAEWISADPDDVTGIRNLKIKIDFLSQVLYKEYRPTMAGVNGEFQFRLAKWIGSATSDDHKKLMFLLLEHLFFVGKNEFDSLYLTAYSRHIATWLLVEGQIDFTAPDAKDQVRAARDSTLFSAVTDSFNIGDFLRINSIQGAEFRFVWEQAIKVNWDPVEFERVAMAGKNRIVLLEDFVGSGSQMERAVRTACTLPGAPEVLLCPLIICPAGAILAKNLVQEYTNLTFKPVLELNSTDFVQRISEPGEPAIFSEFRILVEALHTKIAGSQDWTQDYGPYGYGGTGGLIVKYDNTPDNTLPILHHASNTPWHPLFLRNSRLAE
ncbi:MAG: hypothetical protein HHJ12_16450 [Glaciimonas sp.]|nr:hypothetical protein [Glaciimonas sp.]